MLQTLRVNPRFLSWVSKTEWSYTRNGGWQGKGTQPVPQMEGTRLHVPATATHGERRRLGKRKSRMEERGKASTSQEQCVTPIVTPLSAVVDATAEWLRLEVTLRNHNYCSGDNKEMVFCGLWDSGIT